MTDYSFLAPFVPVRPEQLLPYGALAQCTSTHRFWQGQSTGSDPLQTFTHVAAAGFRTPVGLAVSLMPMCHPFDAAMRVQSLAAGVGNSVVAGFGPGAKILQSNLLGAPYRSQLGAVREYVTIVRGLLTQGEFTFEGEFFSCRGQMARIPLPTVEIGLGVLRPGMAELAGELADVAITWMCSADYLRETVLPALRRGAEKAGRPVPRLVAMVPLAKAGPERDLTQIVLSGSGGHMQLPHYIDMLDRSGVTVDMKNSPEASAKALVQHEVFLHGDEDEVAAKLARYEEAGVDEVVFNVTGLCAMKGHKTALKEIESLLARAARPEGALV